MQRRAVLLAWCVVGLAAATEADKSTRSAQCRAMCLDEYHIGRKASHTKCLQSQPCFMCWEKCSSLHDIIAAKSTTCDRLPDCNGGGCQKACQFHVSPPEAPRDLPRSPALLQMEFGWSEARWTVTQDERREESIVYVLLARSGDRWKELVQTPEASVVLINLQPGTSLRLLALTRHGVLSVTEAVFEPTEPARLVLDVQEDQLADAEDKLRLDTYEIEIPGAWLLETVSVARDENMVLAEITWEPQTSGPADYLVTWEVSGGGIKGHLYTDMTSVTLSLWPESIYNIQVELMSAESQDLEPLRSVPLVISTYTTSATTRSVHKVPRSALAGEPETSVYIGPQAMVFVVLAFLFCGVGFLIMLVGGWLRYRVTRAQARSEPLPKCVSRSVVQKSVSSPVEVVAVHTAGHLERV